MKTTFKARLTNDVKSKFIEACQRLDTSIFEPYMKEEQCFQNLDKFRFLQSMKDEFDRVKGKGIKSMVQINGTCKGCYVGHESYQFFGKKVTPEFSYVILRSNEGGVKDIHRCNASSDELEVNKEIIEDYDFWK